MESIELMPVRVRIASILKKAIYCGEYKAGDELSLTDIAAQLGVSRTPVREAFQQLSSEGLITLRMNRGAVVNLIGRKFIEDCFEVRILLEAETAAKAAMSGMETDSLLSRAMLCSEQIDTVSKEIYEELNQDIHMAIWNAAGNEKMKSYLLELWNGPSTGHSLPQIRQHYKDSASEHIRILEAIRDRDAQRAREEMASHISRSRDNIVPLYPDAT